MIAFIADFFESDIPGGAERNDAVLLAHLKSKYNVKELLSRNCKINDIIDSSIIIIGNFVHLPEDVKQYIAHKKKYVIYEHDHKYVKTRDPSKFKDFIIPQSQLVNEEFYRSAQKIVCLGVKQVEIINRSFDFEEGKCVSIGTSLWTESSLEMIRDFSHSEKKEKVAIVDYQNPIKNTKKAIAFCESKGIDYDLISSDDPKDFLKILSHYKSLVFFPGVLESLCRLVVEAKMMGCQIITTPKNLGASYEDWFVLKGPELVDVIKSNVNSALVLFEELIDGSRQEKEEVTAILTCYRRPEYLEEQIQALRLQTSPPKEIWVWVNYHEDNENYDFSTLNVDRVFKNDFNWKFHGRFAAAQLCRTKYIALFDDDTIPGSKWFDNCKENIKNNPGIYGGIGVILNDKKYYGHTRVGWSNPNEQLQEVDLVGHAWFFEKSSLQYMWREEPFTWENGEDIQLSYLCKKHGNLKTYVPPHPLDDMEKFSSLKGMKYGVDNKATSRPENHTIFYSERDAQVVDSIDNGWETVRGIK
tara:strand:+ start:6053 stop:7636 length:1584 start_codon:yes stop_codon:yes gene_type:complete